MSLPLVSVITPCYNGEDYLDRYFKSILSQTYPNIELIFVNDGSTDRTEEITLSYKSKIENKGYTFCYISQKNAGQAAAINKGLQIITGDYLTWPDSDDWMSPDCIEKKVNYLEKHPQMGWVQCQTVAVDEKNLNQSVAVFIRNNTENGWLFDDLVFERDIYFAPGGYMVRTDALLSAIPSRHIYECKTGQNWQLMLPISYRYECGFLDEVLYYYVVRRDSHSRTEKDYNSEIEKTYRHEDTLVHVLSEIEMPNDKRDDYLKRIETKYIRRRMSIGAKYHIANEMKDYYGELVKRNVVTNADKMLYLRAVLPPLDYAWRAASLCTAGIRRMIRR